MRSKAKKTNYTSQLNLIFSGQRNNFILMTIYFVIKSSPAWVMPIATAKIIDIASTGDLDKTAELIKWSVLIIILVAQNVPSHVMYVKYFSEINRSIGKRLRNNLCRHLQHLSILFHNSNSIGKLHSKSIRDVEIVEQTPRILVEQVLNFIIQVAIAIVVIAIRNPMALIFFLAAVPVSVFINLTFRSIIEKRTSVYRNSVEKLSESFNDMLTMIPITRAHGLEEHEIDNVEQKVATVFESGKKFDLTSAAFGSFAWASMNIIQILFILGSAYACMKGHITIGDIVLFNSMLLILSGQIIVLLNTVPQIKLAQESLVSLYEVLNSPNIEDNIGKRVVDKVDGEFVFENVSYKYPDTDKHAIKNISFKVKKGESVAFVGPSGCGKSTMLSFILGFLRPDDGRVLIDSNDIEELDMRTVRRNYALVTQETVLFSGSIYDNVSYGINTISREEVVEALKAANAWDFVQSLPNQLDTQIGSTGVKLSGGQKQRLAIARAIVRQPSVLIFDEATSALDADSEHKVQKATEGLMKGRTAFIVAHKVHTLRNVDRVFILEDGRIVDEGTPSELLEKDNFFSRSASISSGNQDSITE